MFEPSPEAELIINILLWVFAAVCVCLFFWPASATERPKRRSRWWRRALPSSRASALPPPDPKVIEAALRAKLYLHLRSEVWPSLMTLLPRMPRKAMQELAHSTVESQVAACGLDPSLLKEEHKDQPIWRYLGLWEAHHLDRRAMGEETGSILIGTEHRDRPVHLSQADRARHTYVLGATGCGKTNLLVQLIDEDIAAGRTVVVLDMRGDLVDRVLRRLNMTASGTADTHFAWMGDPFREELVKRICLVDLRQTLQVTGINPLSGPGEVHNRVMHTLSIIKGHVDSWGIQIEDTARSVLVALAEAGYTLVEVEPLLTDEQFRNRVLANVTDPFALSFFDRFNALSPEKQMGMVLPILNKVLPFLAIPRLRLTLGSPSPLNWPALLDRKPGSIVLVALAADHLHGGASAIGSMIMGQLSNAMFARGDRPESSRRPVALYVDEFENFGTHNFAKFVEEGRRFGIQLTLAHQALVQIPKELRDLIQNCVRTQIFFQTGAIDARILVRELQTNYGDETPSHLMKLPVGEAYLVVRGERTRRIAIALAREPHVPKARIGALRQVSQAFFGLPARDVEIAIAKRRSGKSEDGGGVRHGKRPRL